MKRSRVTLSLLLSTLACSLVSIGSTGGRIGAADIGSAYEPCVSPCPIGPVGSTGVAAHQGGCDLALQINAENDGIDDSTSIRRPVPSQSSYAGPHYQYSYDCEYGYGCGMAALAPLDLNKVADSDGSDSTEPIYDTKDMTFFAEGPSPVETPSLSAVSSPWRRPFAAENWTDEPNAAIEIISENLDQSGEFDGADSAMGPVLRMAADLFEALAATIRQVERGFAEPLSREAPQIVDEPAAAVEPAAPEVGDYQYLGL